ncbi:MAG TPA: hypothetical protein VJ001_03895, partial [Rhodocyclaceae bacterium]|nr:hypothetical protein [Rhodocyclaceae bacterium]
MTDASTTDSIIDDYDTPWKTALVRYFPEFMAFYFPAAYAGIDWTKPYLFLDKELAQVVQDAELGKRIADCGLPGAGGIDAWRTRMDLYPYRDSRPARPRICRAHVRLQLPDLRS